MPTTSPEKLAYIKDWNKKNKEHREQYYKEWLAKNKERVKQKSKEYYEKNKDKRKEYNLANRDKIKERMKKWRQRDSSKKTSKIEKWIARGVIDTDYSALYEAVLKETNCYICGNEFKDSFDRCLDHDHDTGEVRYIVCRDCNMFFLPDKKNIWE